MGWPAQGLRYFRREEFTEPDMVDAELLELLDEIRHRIGVPVRVTSDFRNLEEHETIYPDPSRRPNSPHLRGIALDFTPMPFTFTNRMAVLRVVGELYDEGKCPFLGFEIANRHFHLDLDLVLQRPHLWTGNSK